MLSHAIKLNLVSFTPMVCYRSIGKPSGSLNQILDRSLWTKSVQLLATRKYRDRQYSPERIRGSGTWVRSPFQLLEYHLLFHFISFSFVVDGRNLCAHHQLSCRRILLCVSLDVSWFMAIQFALLDTGRRREYRSRFHIMSNVCPP